MSMDIYNPNVAPSINLGLEQLTPVVDNAPVNSVTLTPSSVPVESYRISVNLGECYKHRICIRAEPEIENIWLNFEVGERVEIRGHAFIVEGIQNNTLLFKPEVIPIKKY